MCRIMLHCFHAVKSKLDRRIGLFELLGFDFLIDCTLKVYTSSDQWSDLIRLLPVNYFAFHYFFFFKGLVIGNKRESIASSKLSSFEADYSLRSR